MDEIERKKSRSLLRCERLKSVNELFPQPEGRERFVILLARTRIPYSCLTLGLQLDALSLRKHLINFILYLCFSPTQKRLKTTESEKVSKSAEGKFGGKIGRGDSRVTSEGRET